ncbi:MAG: amidohydrolase [Acidobacteria bacterium]|nr:amidohydrolase [Acidobacteriota bacterium]
MAEIARIKAVDNHCHCGPAGVERAAKWRADDPLGAPPYPAVVRLRVDNPEWLRAWRALYGYQSGDMSGPRVRGLFETKLRLLREDGEHWPALVLDRAGVETALVNADELGPGQAGTRFRWVPFADPLIRPYNGGERLHRLMQKVQAGTRPSTLAAYTTVVVTPTLERWRRDGAVAVKFLAAYRRALDFAAVPEADAARIYEQQACGEKPSPAGEKALEDYLFRYVAREAGRVGLVVHIHTGNGNGPYFNNGNANPELLEPALGDPALQGTKFVLLHGGWPYHKVAMAMMDKPNTYADFSAQTFYLSARALSEVLRDWLEWQPEKVLFGSDAYSDENTPLADWEEKEWLMTTTAREALALALTGMMRDGEITRPRAIEIARMVLRENAIKLYHLK